MAERQYRVEGVAMNSQKCILRAEEGYLGAARKGDAALASSYFTDDAICYPANSAPLSGKVEIERIHRHEFKEDIDAKWRTFKTLEARDEILVIGTYEIRNPKHDNALVDKGNQMIIWKRCSDNEWRIHRYMWVSSLPRKNP